MQNTAFILSLLALKLAKISHSPFLFRLGLISSSIAAAFHFSDWSPIISYSRSLFILGFGSVSCLDLQPLPLTVSILTAAFHFSGKQPDIRNSFSLALLSKEPCSLLFIRLCSLAIAFFLSGSTLVSCTCLRACAHLVPIPLGVVMLGSASARAAILPPVLGDPAKRALL